MSYLGVKFYRLIKCGLGSWERGKGCHLGFKLEGNYWIRNNRKTSFERWMMSSTVDLEENLRIYPMQEKVLTKYRAEIVFMH